MGRTAQILKHDRSAARRRHDAHATGGAKRARGAAADANADRENDEPLRRPFPSEAQQRLLLASPADASRLQPSAIDLCQLVRALMPAAASRSGRATTAAKQARAENGDASKVTTVAAAAASGPVVKGASARAVFDALKPALESLIVDEAGVSVVESIICGAGHEGAGDAAEADRELGCECIDAVIFAVRNAAVQRASDEAEADAAPAAASLAPRVDDETDEGQELVDQPLAALRLTSLYALATHSAARRLVWAMLEHGTKAQRRELNRELAAECLNLATDRHGVHALLALLEHYPTSRRTVVPALLPIVASDLLPDPVGYRAAVALIGPETAIDLLDALGIATVVAAVAPEATQYGLGGPEKRTLRFAVELLDRGLHKQPSDDAETAAKRGAAVVALASALQPQLIELAQHVQANFAVQALLRAMSSYGTGDATVGAALQTAVQTFLKNKQHPLTELASHPIAAHALGVIASSAPTAVAAALRPNLLKLACDKFGSIAIRRLIENSGTHAHAVAAALLQAMGQHVDTFMADEHGNLVVQAVLRGLAVPERSKFFDSFVAPRAAELCQHRFAAHVVHALVTGTAAGGAPLDASGLNRLFGALKRHLVDLAQHVNGRFVVEALLGPFREAQKLLIDALPTLIVAQGSQGVLVKLYDLCDAAMRTQLAGYVAQHLSELATNKQGSLVLQKWMSADLDAEQRPSPVAKPATVLAAVRAALNSESAKQALRGDFFGRFVVQLADGRRIESAPPREARPDAAGSRGGSRGGVFDGRGRGGSRGGGFDGRGRGGAPGRGGLGGRGGGGRGGSGAGFASRGGARGGRGGR